MSDERAPRRPPPYAGSAPRPLGSARGRARRSAPHPRHRMADRAGDRLRDSRAWPRTAGPAVSSSAVMTLKGELAPLDHGGNLGAAREMFPGAPEPFLDLSTGINPHPYPVPQLSAGSVNASARAGRPCRARGDRRRGLWRAVSGPCRGGSGFANPRGADGILVGARPRFGPCPDLLRARASGRACRP